MNPLFLALLAAVPAADASQYREPPAPIPAILDAAPAPSVSLSPDRKWLLVMERTALPPISEVAAPELRLAGIRLNPHTYSGRRTAAVFTLTFSAPAIKMRLASTMLRIPPPTVYGIKTRCAVRKTTSAIVARLSLDAVISRNTISSAPCRL